MAQDHYIPQTYLRGWLGPGTDRRLYAIRKADLKTFRPGPHSVCTTDEGSTNEYLQEPRIIERILPHIERNYRGAVETISSGRPDPESVATVSGFIACAELCSPTGMRLGAAGVAPFLEQEVKQIDAQGLLPDSPSALGGRSLTELLNDGTVDLNIDERYPQAIGVTQVFDLMKTIGNSS